MLWIVVVLVILLVVICVVRSSRKSKSKGSSGSDSSWMFFDLFSGSDSNGDSWFDGDGGGGCD